MTDPARQLRVLIVDDDFMVARVHRGFVERIEGFTAAGEARSGTEALEAVRELSPDVVLLDVYLPDLSGLEVLERLRGLEQSRDVDVVMITAAKDVTTVSRSLRSGALHYLIKPFRFEDLRARLLQVADTRRGLAGASGVADLAQTEVDRLFGPGPANRGQELPKGLSRQTMNLVVKHLREQTEDRSATQVGKGIGVSRVSARRYLEHLVTVGRVRVALRYGEAGRPERRYRWRAPDAG